MGHVAIAVSFLCRQKMAPAIEARVGGRIGWQVVVGVYRRVVARFIGIGRIDGNCGWTTCRSAMELECARPHIAIIFVPGHPAPATRAAADTHQRAFGKIENKFSSRGGRRPKRNVGGGFTHHGERGAGAHGKRHGSGEHSDQSAHVSPLFHLGTRSAQFHAALQRTNRRALVSPTGNWRAHAASYCLPPGRGSNRSECCSTRYSGSRQSFKAG